MPYKSKTYSSRRFGGNFHGGGKSSYSSSSSRGRSGGGNRRGPKKDYIDPARFIKVAAPSEEMAYTPLHSFADFDVNPLIKQNVAAKGYVTPTPIQDKTIPQALAGRDIIGIADTGTGKTAAFAIPILHAMMLGDARVLVIAPTRELAQQIDAEFRWIAKGSNLHGATLIGGAGIGPQLRDLRSNPQIVRQARSCCRAARRECLRRSFLLPASRSRVTTHGFG